MGANIVTVIVIVLGVEQRFVFQSEHENKYILLSFFTSDTGENMTWKEVWLHFKVNARTIFVGFTHFDK